MQVTVTHRLLRSDVEMGLDPPAPLDGRHIQWAREEFALFPLCEAVAFVVPRNPYYWYPGHPAEREVVFILGLPPKHPMLSRYLGEALKQQVILMNQLTRG